MRLSIRTPTRTIVERDIESLTAEDSTGRFGIRPQMEPLLSVLVPSLITYRSQGEIFFVAADRGLLLANQTSVRIMIRRAVECSSLDAVEKEIEAVQGAARSSEQAARGAFSALYRQLQHSLLKEGRAE